MRYCYGRTEKGKLVRLAKIYTKEEHHISKKKISSDVIWMIKTLISHGHRAFVVGGAIRDLLAQKIPKDFDIVTDAHPIEIKKYFKRAQIVGKRFPIVLIRNSQGNFIEVSTFRSDSDYPEKEMPQKNHKKRTVHTALENTEFGSIEQDVKRRDFTCNALYYDINQETILDFVEGVQHLKEKKLVVVRAMFDEDPVRMLRAIKYSRKVGLTIPLSLKKSITRNIKLLEQVPSSRKGEEVMKILVSGVSAPIMEDLFSYKILAYVLPEFYAWHSKRKQAKKDLFIALAEADKQIEERYSRIRGLQAFIKEFVLNEVREQGFPKNGKKITQQEIHKLFTSVKNLLYPITPPNVEIHKAIMSVLVSEKLMPHHSSAKRFNPTSRRRRSS